MFEKKQSKNVFNQAGLILVVENGGRTWNLKKIAQGKERKDQNQTYRPVENAQMVIKLVNKKKIFFLSFYLK